MFQTTIIFRRPFVPRAIGQSCRLLPRSIHGSHITRRHDPPNPVLHGVENYFVDGDDTPPPKSPIYKVDATSDAAQSAYEPPSEPWSQASAGSGEYQTVSKISSGSDVKLRYGRKKRDTENKGPETSKAGEGTER